MQCFMYTNAMSSPRQKGQGTTYMTMKKEEEDNVKGNEFTRCWGELGV